jgi:ABC-2 type transport system permease protein
MRRIGMMVRKDLLRQRRAPLAVLLTLAFPLLFSALIALTFGGSGDRMPKVQLLVEDRDQSWLSGALLTATENEQFGEYFEVRAAGPDGRSQMEQGEASALWVIPRGFGADFLAGRPVRFELVLNPAQSILPEIAEQMLTVLVDLLSGASRVLREPLDQLQVLIDEDSPPGPEAITSISLAVYHTIEGVAEYVNPPVITLESIQLADETEADATAGPGGSDTGNIFLFVLPGVAVWSLFMLGDLAMRDLLTETTKGTLRRQLSGPMPPWQIIAAKALYAAALATIGLIVLSGIGLAVAPRPVDPAGFIMLSLAVVLAVTGFASVVYGGAPSERAGTTLSSVVLLILAFAGGAFIQTSQMPRAVQRISPFSPFYWGTEGYRELIQGGGAVQVLTHTGVLAGIGVVLLTAGSLLLDHRVRRGAGV